jgi:hypothetical protein
MAVQAAPTLGPAAISNPYNGNIGDFERALGQFLIECGQLSRRFGGSQMQSIGEVQAIPHPLNLLCDCVEALTFHGRQRDHRHEGSYLNAVKPIHAAASVEG